MDTDDDPFDPVLGARRGSDRGDAPEVPGAPMRALIYEAARARVTFYTVLPELTDALRFLVLARSEHSDDLHIIGGAADIDGALVCCDEADEFSPESVIDLDGPSVDECVRMTYEERGATGQDRLLIEREYSLGVDDLN